VFGFVSDACPVVGMHRKPYFTFGSLVYSFAFMFYSLIDKDDIIILAICIFVGTLGLIQLDVMADTMCVERSRFEPESSRVSRPNYSIRVKCKLVVIVFDLLEVS
jgi:hypothetical protein